MFSKNLAPIFMSSISLAFENLYFIPTIKSSNVLDPKDITKNLVRQIVDIRNFPSLTDETCTSVK